jgi:hypothetical protein
MNEYVKQMFRYEDGNLYRIKASGGMKSGSMCGWTTICNGKQYKKINIKRKTYYLHQIIYMYFHGHIPEYIDHKDGDSLNNRIENLRTATQSQNAANQRLRKTNRSGIKGVRFNERYGKWTAAIMVNRKHISLGCHASAEEAKKAYEVGSKKYFGEFARSDEIS